MTAPETRASTLPHFSGTRRGPTGTNWWPRAPTDKDQQDETRKAKDELKNMYCSRPCRCSTLWCSPAPDVPKLLMDHRCGTCGMARSAKNQRTRRRRLPPKSTTSSRTSNIEALLSRVEAFLQVNEGDNAVEGFLNSSKQVILDKCSAFLEADKLGAHKVFLHRLSRRRVRDQRLQVFTTNYDVCFERAAAELGGVALDGFSFTAPRRYDPRFFGYDIIRRPRSGDDLGHYLEGVFLLYKLHGSVNWARGEEGAIYEKETSRRLPRPA